MLLNDTSGSFGLPPEIMTEEAACADLYLPNDVAIGAKCFSTIDLLIAFDIPLDWCLFLQPRSSTFTKKGLLSTTGIIDSDYKGSVHAQLFNMNDNAVYLERGTRLVQVQLVQKQRMQLERVDILPLSSRINHIGSTGE
jgi:deoxyuridine 5'-triphosphate nucleotidohydrolase